MSKQELFVVCASSLTLLLSMLTAYNVHVAQVSIAEVKQALIDTRAAAGVIPVVPPLLAK